MLSFESFPEVEAGALFLPLTRLPGAGGAPWLSELGLLGGESFN